MKEGPFWGILERGEFILTGPMASRCANNEAVPVSGTRNDRLWVENELTRLGQSGVPQKVQQMEKKGLSEQKVQEIVRRIVEVAQPEKIILFGSAARGQLGPNSDVDVMVVKSGVHRRKLAGDIYMKLYGVGQAVDVVVVTPEDIERYGKCPALVIEPALREGRLVYDASAVSAR